MAKRKSVARRRRQNETNKAIRNVVILLVVAGIIGYFVYQAYSSHRSLDEETLCPPQVDSVTVLLVDVTDPMNLPQRQDFSNELEVLMKSIPRYGKLVITKVDPVSDQLLQPILTRCNPGSAKDISDVTGNKKMITQQRREGFEIPVRATLDEILEASSANRSPILESIQSVNITELRNPSVGDEVPLKLVVASDLLQNTENISFYRNLPDSASIIDSQAFSRTRTDLQDITVELWMLQRDDSNVTQPRDLIDLWDQIISAQGGRVARVYRVNG